jgi:glycosyltransferase involved in cell wall biosynthesis
MTAPVPILAMAPRGSYFARHVQTHGYAELVDEPGPALLHRKLLQLLDDEPTRARLIAKARETVSQVFALDKVAPLFASASGIRPSAPEPLHPPA